MTAGKYWAQRGVLSLLLFLPLLLAFELWPIDFWVADRLYDRSSGDWIGGGTWWAKGLIHTGGVRLVLFIFVTAGALYLASFRFRSLQAWRRPSLFVALAILICTSLVALLKHYSNVDCPEDLMRYGGDRLYVHIFAAKPEGAARGACFPGGHSSGAFSLMAFYFVLCERGARMALPVLFAVLALGGVYAFGQWTRGEHLPSHDLWSAMICWYVLLALYAKPFRGQVWSTLPTRVGASHGTHPVHGRPE